MTHCTGFQTRMLSRLSWAEWLALLIETMVSCEGKQRAGFKGDGMQALGEINASNRYITQSVYSDTSKFIVIDRVNGFRVGEPYADGSAARAAADTFNRDGLPLASG